MKYEYYAKGAPSHDEELNKKILKDAKICHWHDEVDEDFTGYIKEVTDKKTGKITKEFYDICGVLFNRDYRKEYERSRERFKKFCRIRDCVIISTTEINKMSNQIDQISETKSKINGINKKLIRGWVQDTNKIGGSKRRRRYKKDSRRFLTEEELKKLRTDKEYYMYQLEDLESRLNIDKFLYETVKRMYGIKKETIGDYHLAYGYHETEGIYIIYELRLESLKEKINHLAYNDLVQKETAARLEVADEDSESASETEADHPKISRKSIKVFEEKYKRAFEIVKEEQENYTVTSERSVSNRARFFIDRDGNRVELGTDVRQVVLHN